MVILYVYYNPNSDKFYYKSCVTNSQFDTRIENSHGHVIVQKLCVVNNKIYDLNYYLKLKELDQDLKHQKALTKRAKKIKRKKIIKKLINRLIDLLYMLKSRI